MAVASSATAGLLFTDDFNGPSVGNAISNTKWSLFGGSAVVRDASTQELFGNPQRYGRFSGVSVRARAAASLPVGGVLTAQFRFHEPSGGGNQALVFGFGKSDEINGTHAGLAFSLRDGMLAANSNTSGPSAAYPLDVACRITLIFNRSGSELSYTHHGDHSLGNGQAHLWFAEENGSPVKVGTYTSTANTNVANQWLFRTFSAATGNTVDVDDMMIQEGVELEPWEPGANWRSSLYPDDWTAPGSEDVDFLTDAFMQDFSHAGYRRGDVELPEIEAPEWVVTDAPFLADASGNTDATLAIQSAIDAASAAGGGVVKLPAGTYRIRPQGGANHALRIQSPNIVLKGAGIGQTYLFNDSTEMRSKRVILVEGSSAASFTHGGSGSSPLVADLAGPATVIPVGNAGLFEVGDWVTVRSDATEAWISEHGVGNWSGFGSNLGGLAYRRQVVAVDVEENLVTLDIPTRYALKMRDNARLVLATNSGLAEVGLEDFSIGMQQRGGTAWGENDYTGESNTSYQVHSSYAVAFRRARDGWMKNVASYQPVGNVTTAHILSGGVLLEDSCRITVSDCHFQRPQYGGGGGNGYMYRLSNSMDCLLIRCEATFSRHGFVFSQMRASGNVLHRCTDRSTGKQTGNTGNQNTNGTGSDHHMHFSHSNLVDACVADSSFFIAAYRPFGTAPMHEVTAAHSVFWNTEGSGSGGAVVRSEQSRYGYVIGTRGSRSSVELPSGGGARMAPVDIVHGAGAGDSLTPFSLYEDQLLKRQASLSSALEIWREFHFGEDAGNPLIAGNDADPDGDGKSNLMEFAIAGNPKSGAEPSRISADVKLLDETNHFVLTLPMRLGADFSGSGPLVSLPIDGVIYRIEAWGHSSELGNPEVVEVPSSLEHSLPDLPMGWEYRHFQFTQPVSELPRGFLRLGVNAAQ